MAIEGVAHLQPQRVARAQADRQRARLEQRFPDRRRVLPAAVELEAVLAGIAGAGDEALAPGDLAVVVVIVGDVDSGGRRAAAASFPRWAPGSRSGRHRSEMSFRRTFAPPFRSTMCSHAEATLAAFTTIISLSSNRYTVQSSTKVPSRVRMPEYCTWPGASAPTSLQVIRLTKAFRSGPVTSNSPMWDTSKIPTFARTA